MKLAPGGRLMIAIANNLPADFRQLTVIAAHRQVWVLAIVTAKIAGAAYGAMISRLLTCITPAAAQTRRSASWRSASELT